MGLATDTRLNALEQLLERTLAGLGYELVDFSLSNHGRMLRVFIDKLNEQHGPASGQLVGPGVTVADCEAATRQLQKVLAVEAVEYDRMEVSSPGLDRKLRKPADFVRFAGQEADVRLREPINGRRRFVGVLRQVIGKQVEIEINGAPMLLPLANLDKARLVPKYAMQGRRSR
jgi:ribosome maturation factor RimP